MPVNCRIVSNSEILSSPASPSFTFGTVNSKIFTKFACRSSLAQMRHVFFFTDMPHSSLQRQTGNAMANEREKNKCWLVFMFGATTRLFSVETFSFAARLNCAGPNMTDVTHSHTDDICIWIWQLISLRMARQPCVFGVQKRRWNENAHEINCQSVSYCVV